MIIKFFVSESEMKEYFEACGYTCVYAEVTRFRQAYHSRSEAYQSDELFVRDQDSSRLFPAATLFEQTIKAQLMRTDLTAKLAIKKAVLTIKKSN